LNSKFIEFVWLFDTKTTSLKNQIIFKVCKDGNIILKGGFVCIDTNEYTQKYITSGIISTSDIIQESLIILKNDVVKELSNI
jgi:hypothetical protein